MHCEIVGDCPYGQFACGNGECIPEWYRCNGWSDCEDNSDEARCDIEESCEHNEWQCDSGECIPLRYICDDLSDCQDGSDETKCAIAADQCGEDYSCDNGQCIPVEYICNEWQDCADNSDERYCVACSEDEWMCRDGKQCVPLQYVCENNGRMDCHDGSDEVNCPTATPTGVPTHAPTQAPTERPTERPTEPPTETKTQAQTQPDATQTPDEQKEETEEPETQNPETQQPETQQPATQPPEASPTSGFCAPDEWHCRSGECVPIGYYCDFEWEDCLDGSDEAFCGCLAEEWECTSGECISRDSVCDGLTDCPDGSDENPGMCSPEEVEVPDEEVEEVAAPDEEAEQVAGHGPEVEEEQEALVESEEIAGCSAEEWQCDDGECIPLAYYCDEWEDCADLSDHVEGCVPLVNITCADEEFKCINANKCIPESQRCDGVGQCTDRSDETTCVCTEAQWECANGECIAADNRCDLTQFTDCFDGSDEMGCPCREDEWSCASGGVCIRRDERCDGKFHCPDYSDEDDTMCCSDTEFRCELYNCVDIEAYCDGYVDCNNGLDEPNDCSQLVNPFARGELHLYVRHCIVVGMRPDDPTNPTRPSEFTAGDFNISSPINKHLTFSEDEHVQPGIYFILIDVLEDLFNVTLTVETFDIKETTDVPPAFVNPSQVLELTVDTPFTSPFMNHWWYDVRDGYDLDLAIDSSNPYCYPDWLEFDDSEGGVMSGMAPSTSGRYTVLLTAANTRDVQGWSLFDLVVLPKVREGFSLDSQILDVNTSWHFSIPDTTFINANPDTITIVTDLGSLPEWLDFDRGNRQLSGVPPESDVITLFISAQGRSRTFETTEMQLMIGQARTDVIARQDMITDPFRVPVYEKSVFTLPDGAFTDDTGVQHLKYEIAFSRQVSWVNIDKRSVIPRLVVQSGQVDSVDVFITATNPHGNSDHVSVTIEIYKAEQGVISTFDYPVGRQWRWIISIPEDGAEGISNFGNKQVDDQQGEDEEGEEGQEMLQRRVAVRFLFMDIEETTENGCADYLSIGYVREFNNVTRLCGEQNRLHSDQGCFGFGDSFVSNGTELEVSLSSTDSSSNFAFQRGFLMVYEILEAGDNHVSFYPFVGRWFILELSEIDCGDCTLAGALTAHQTMPDWLVIDSEHNIALGIPTSVDDTLDGDIIKIFPIEPPPTSVITCWGEQLFINGTGTITDGSGGEPYSPSLNCFFAIRPLNLGDGRIFLEVTSFDSDYPYDSLNVFEGTSAEGSPIATASGTVPVGKEEDLLRVLGSPGQQLYLQWKTDHASTGKMGWEMKWSIYDESTSTITELYVDKHGASASDIDNDCSSTERTCLTISHALEQCKGFQDALSGEEKVGFICQVSVAAGIYLERSLEFETPVNLLGANRDNTVIDGEGERGLNLQNLLAHTASSKISGFTFTNTAANTLENSKVDFEDCTFETGMSGILNIDVGFYTFSDCEFYSSSSAGLDIEGLVKDENGEFLEDVLVALYLKDDGGAQFRLFETALTNHKGAYSFSGVIADDYEVTIPDQDVLNGRALITKNQNDDDVNFVYTESDGADEAVQNSDELGFDPDEIIYEWASIGIQGTVRGDVFNDENGNAIKDIDEYGFVNVTVVFVEEGSEEEALIYGVLTDAFGSYEASLPMGTYIVHILPDFPEIEESKLTGSERLPLELVLDGDANLNFGYQKSGSVTGIVRVGLSGITSGATVFIAHDKNKNGIFDALPTSDDELEEAEDLEIAESVFARTLTTRIGMSNDGFKFSELPPGDYLVIVPKQPIIDGFLLTQGVNPNIISLSIGQTVDNVNFVYTPRRDSAAIYVVGGTEKTVNIGFDNVRFHDLMGGGFHEDGAFGTVWFNECEFVDNQNIQEDVHDGIGAGIHGSLAYYTITNSDFVNNEALYGPAIGLVSKSDDLPINADITSCTFTDNKATISGGAMYTINAAVTLNDCKFTHNRADEDGGAIFADRTPVFESTNKLEIGDTKFLRNKAQYSGGAIWIDGSEVIISRTDFTEHISKDGTILMKNSTNLINDACGRRRLRGALLDNVVITRNVAERDGGGIVLEGGANLVVNNSDISWNNSTAGAGGGIITRTDDTSLSLYHTRIERNEAQAGGGVHSSGKIYIGEHVQFLKNKGGICHDFHGGGIWFNRFDCKAVTVSDKRSTIIFEENSGRNFMEFYDFGLCPKDYQFCQYCNSRDIQCTFDLHTNTIEKDISGGAGEIKQYKLEKSDDELYNLRFASICDSDCQGIYDLYVSFGEEPVIDEQDGYECLRSIIDEDTEVIDCFWDGPVTGDYWVDLVGRTRFNGAKLEARKEKPPENWDMVLIGLLIGMFVLFAISIPILKKKSPEGARVLDFPVVVLSIFDFAMDCRSAYIIYQFPPEQYRTAFYACVVFLVLPFVSNMVLTYRFIFESMRDHKVRMWFKESIPVVTVTSMIACTNFDAMTLLNSQILGHKFFSAPFPKYTDQKIQRRGMISLILEDIPQIVIQSMIRLTRTDTSITASLVSSSLSIFAGLTKRGLLWCTQYYDHKHKATLKGQTNLELELISGTQEEKDTDYDGDTLTKKPKGGKTAVIPTIAETAKGTGVGTAGENPTLTPQDYVNNLQGNWVNTDGYELEVTDMTAHFAGHNQGIQMRMIDGEIMMNNWRLVKAKSTREKATWSGEAETVTWSRPEPSEEKDAGSQDGLMG